jgi:hypothetical protein
VKKALWACSVFLLPLSAREIMLPSVGHLTNYMFCQIITQEYIYIIFVVEVVLLEVG